MLTQEDIKNLVGVFATKQELKEELSKLEARFDQKQDKVMTAVDAVLKEVITIRQEQTSHFQEHQDTKEKLENHDKRIEKLEVSVNL